MIYRTAHRATYRSLNNNLNTLSYRIAQLTNQIASERRINTPSDDPSGAATVLNTRSNLSAIKQYSANIAVSDLWLSDSGTAIQSMKETLDQMKSVVTMQGSTDTYSETQRSQIMAEQVTELFQSLIQFGNTKIGGSGSYIFGGQAVTTQPFSLKVEAQKVIMGCQNSDKWTGKVVNYGDAKFNNRPDLPIQSQDFLIEVVRAGGVASQYYSNVSDLASGSLKGNGYTLAVEAGSKQYNNTSIKLVAGPEPQTTTGEAAQNNGITWGGTASPTKVVYTYGTTGATTASWDAGSNTLTVALETNGSGASVATAQDIVSAANGAVPGIASLTGGNAGTGRVDPLLAMGGKTHIGYNYGTYAERNGNDITVYLQRDNTSGQLVADAAAVENAIFQVAGGDLNITRTGNGPVSPSASALELRTAEPYTLAQATIDPKGTQNGLIWSVKNDRTLNGTGYLGQDGNKLSVAYVVPQNPFSTTPSIDFDPNTNEITVNLAASAAIYTKVFAQVYNDPQSGAYKDMDKANEMALKEAIQTTAGEVQALVRAGKDINGNDLLDNDGNRLNQIIDVNLADGNSGLGKVNVVPRTSFSEGYTGYALFRVSQDGGKTWGPPMDFSASEYKNGDMFYNASLGHASFTTNISGKANDLVFTATQMGSWGNDLRVEYKLPQTHPSTSTEIAVGPNPWNICVTLRTDANGNVLSTANEIMEKINNDPTASQLVTADLANYHEGGSGVVKVMECQALSVGEPYQVDGVTHITPLGHATGTVSFGYTAPAQKCPNISYQAIEQGPEGNDIGVRYTTSADPTYYSSASVANESYQDRTTVRYETDPATGKTVVVVHLATEALPSCPDPDQDREASDKWKELYPLYSCTSARAVTATAGSVVQAIIDKNTQEPESAVIWPSLERWPDGLESTAKVGPTDGTVWLTGGNDIEDAGNHGVNLRFIMDGTALQVGDVFEVPVGYYRGDDQNIDINASSNYRTTMNTSGDKVLGDNGAEDNLLDTVQRLIYALEKNDSELVAKELETLDAGISKLLTLETQIGSRQIRNEFIQQNLDQAKFSSETLLSTVEDADFSQLITDLKNAQTVYEAVLGATGLTSKISLLNYI